MKNKFISPLRATPNVEYLCRAKTRKNASDVATRRFGQVEAYLTVRQVLSEASTAADDVLSREHGGFCLCRYATLGVTHHASCGWTVPLLKSR